MPHMLHVRSDVALTAVQFTLGRLTTREIALVFPLGEPAALAPNLDATELATLHDFCTLLDKDVVIIGGDHTLRAAAVSAGFAAATSVDAWKEASGWRFAIPALALRESDQVPMALALVEEENDQENDFHVLPDYVQHLLETTEAYTGPLDRNALLEERLAQAERVTLANDDSPTSASERDEEGITTMIRGTSGLTDWQDAGV